MISQERARTLARKYRSKVDFITRLAAFAAATGAGRNPFDVARELGVTDVVSVKRYQLWAARLRDELADAKASYDTTPNDEGDETPCP